MTIPNIPASRADHILLTLGVLTAKLDRALALEATVKEAERRLRATEEKLVRLETATGSSSKTWHLAWNIVNTAILSVVGILTLLHH